jgi:transporter family-2 protein
MIINSHLAKKIGVFQGTFINYVMGLLFTVVVLLVRNNSIDVSFQLLYEIPFWAYLGGLIGVVVVAVSNIIIPQIPTIYTTLLIFSGQLFTGIIIDYFAGGLISKGKIIGGVLIIAGLTYNFNVDKKHALTSTAQNVNSSNESI